MFEAQIGKGELENVRQNTEPIKSAAFCGRRSLLDARMARSAESRSGCARLRTAPSCACWRSKRNWDSTFSRTANFADRISWAISPTRSRDSTSATAWRGAGRRRRQPAPSLGQGPGGRRRGGEASRGSPADRARTAFPEAAQSGRDQDDAAERHAVSGDLLQARADPRRPIRPTRRCCGTSSRS